MMCKKAKQVGATLILEKERVLALRELIRQSPFARNKQGCLDLAVF